jgi:hypothetical protein
MIVFCIRFVRFILTEKKVFIAKLDSAAKFRLLSHKNNLKLKYWYKKAEYKQPSKFALFFIRLISRTITSCVENLRKIRKVNSDSNLVLILHAINFAVDPWVKHKNSTHLTLRKMSQDYFSKRTY